MSCLSHANPVPRKLLHSALCLAVLGTAVPATGAEVSKSIVFSRNIEGYLQQVFRSLPPPSGLHTFVTSAQIEPLSFRGLVQGSLAASYANQMPLAAASNAAFGLTTTLTSGLFNAVTMAVVQSTVQPPSLPQPLALVPLVATLTESIPASLQLGRATTSLLTTTPDTRVTTFTDAADSRNNRQYSQSFTVTQKSELTLDRMLARVVATHQASGGTVSQAVTITQGLQAFQMDLSRSGIWDLALSDVKLAGTFGTEFSMTVSEITFAPTLACIVFDCSEVEYREVRRRTSSVVFGGYQAFEFSDLGLVRPDAQLGSLIVDADITAVPLPSGLPLGIAGLAALLAVARRRRGT